MSTVFRGPISSLPPESTSRPTAEPLAGIGVCTSGAGPFFWGRVFKILIGGVAVILRQ